MAIALVADIAIRSRPGPLFGCDAAWPCVAWLGMTLATIALPRYD